MDYKDKYSHIEIIDDPTKGLVKLGLTERFEADRKSKITNNFVSQTEVLDAEVLKKVIESINLKLPKISANEKNIGSRIQWGTNVNSPCSYTRI